MKLGTIVYNNEIYNLDYMTADEVKEILKSIEMSKKKNINEFKNIDLVKKLGEEN